MWVLDRKVPTKQKLSLWSSQLSLNQNYEDALDGRNKDDTIKKIVVLRVNESMTRKKIKLASLRLYHWLMKEFMKKNRNE